MPKLDIDRLFPLEPHSRDLARSLFNSIKDLPIISPHGHTDPRWFARNENFPDPSKLFVSPDHYVFRMLHSQGVALEDLGVPKGDGTVVEGDGRKIWKLFASNYHLFRATPTSLWIDHALEHVFGIEENLSKDTADLIYDELLNALKSDEFRPRELFERFNIEAIATTESALDPLDYHREIRDSGWSGRVITTYRPDSVVDPETEGFYANVMRLGEITREDTTTWSGYLAAHRNRRAFFKSFGATATDHGHPTARTQDLPQHEAEILFQKALKGIFTPSEAENFRGQMLTEMARMSLDDGLILQIHAGSHRNHNQSIFDEFGRDKGYDIPAQTDYVSALKPLLNVVGTDPRMSIIVFTIDETSYGRELAPLAGVYPALKLGPAWWFFDSPDGMRRYREMTTETAGFYNTVGFNDDTRAFCSIPARHDIARRVDCSFLANLVATGRLDRDDAFEVAIDLTYNLAKKAYRL